MMNYKMVKKKLLRVFITEADKERGKPLYYAIIDLCREKGLSGATVIKGVAGYGLHKVVHTDKILRLSGDLPLIVEVIGEEEKMAVLIPALGDIVSEGLIAVEDIDVVAFDGKS
ncbi:MAG: DUF190 domain-containing protein [Deltaproteobacteria bacterium]|nr:DUF190 domain-containing protein [Deltaproteobacteria bacterium]